MSIRKTFMVDSANKSRGDDAVFEIDIDKNYFNKVPNAIKLINARINVESQFINDSNNKMLVEVLNSNGKIINSKLIIFPPVSSITSYNTFIDNILNPNLKSQMLISGYFNNTWLEFGWTGSAFTLSSLPNVNVNFNVDDSIGDLLGFGRSSTASNISPNVIGNLISVNNFDLSTNKWLYISTGVNTITKYLINIPNNFVCDEDLARVITNKINQTTVGGEIASRYILTASISKINCNYLVSSSVIQVRNDLGIESFNMPGVVYNSLSSGFTFLNQEFKVPYNTTHEDFNFNLVNNQGVIVVNTVIDEIIINSNNVIIFNGSNDGINLLEGDLVLVNTTLMKSFNGVYVVGKGILNRYGSYDGSNIFTTPKLNDFVFVRHNKSYRNSDIRGGFKYDNKIFTLTEAPNPLTVGVSPMYFTEFNSKAIPYHVDHLFDYNVTNIYIGWEALLGKTVYEYGVLMDSLDSIDPSDNGPLYINNVLVQVGELILVNNLMPIYNGIYRCVRNANIWRLERLNYSPGIAVDRSFNTTGTIVDKNEIYNEHSDGDPLLYNGVPLAVGDLLYWNGSGVYKCIDDGSNTGLSSLQWRIRYVFDPNELLYDDGVNPYFMFVTSRGNGDKKLKSFKLTPSGGGIKYYNNKTDAAKDLARIVNMTNNFNLPSFYQEENLYRSYGNVVDMFEDKNGLFSFVYETNGLINPLYKPLYGLEFFDNSIGFTNTVKKGNNTYSGDISVQSNTESFGSFNITLNSNILKSIELVSPNGISSTNDLIELINYNLVTGDQTVNTSNVRVRYQNNAYVFSNNVNFNIDFTISNSVKLGFGNTYLTELNSYTGSVVDLIEEQTKPSNIYICSDLVDSIDSGSIIPLGGPIPVENVMFVIPNVGNYDDTSDNQVLINNSKFAQRFLDNKFNANKKIPIKFWFKLPNGIGFVKKPWFMRCELVFDTVGSL